MCKKGDEKCAEVDNGTCEAKEGGNGCEPFARYDGIGAEYGKMVGWGDMDGSSWCGGYAECSWLYDELWGKG